MAKRTNKTTRGGKPVVPSNFTIREMADFLQANTELAEAFTRADIELALDDRGWLTPGRQWTAADLDAQTRTTLVAKSRLYWMRDPLAHQAVRLWTDYAFGDSGITYNVAEPEDGEGQDETQEEADPAQKAETNPTQAQLDKFMFNRQNRRLMSPEGQRKLSKKLLVDGEIFFAIFDEGDGNKTIRTIDPLQITDIITDPDDEDHILGYKRLTAQDKVLYYYDWTCDDEDRTALEQSNDPQGKGKIDATKVVDDCVVYHLAFDTMLKRGNGLLFTVCDWSKEHRRMMEARVAITQALAKFAWKQKVKGGQAVVNAIQTRLQSTYATSGMTQVERNPTNAPGSTWIENGGMDLTPMPRTTGAGDAESDANQLKLMVSAGTGIMLHYFGDPSTGNLATATAMELPMLKQFGAYQTMWKSAYRDIFSIVLDEDIDTERETIDIDLPPILAEDLQKLGTYLTQLTTVFPEAKVDEVLQTALVSMGMNNVDEVMDVMRAKREEIDAQNQANQDLEREKLGLAPASKQKLPGGKVKGPNVNRGGGKGDPKAILAQKSSGIPSNPESGYATTEAIQLKMIEKLERIMECVS